MMTNIVVKDDDLRLLAMKTGREGSEPLLGKKGNSTRSRIFVNEPKTLRARGEKGREAEPRRFQAEIAGEPAQVSSAVLRCARFALKKMTMPKKTNTPPMMSCRISSPSSLALHDFHHGGDDGDHAVEQKQQRGDGPEAAELPQRQADLRPAFRLSRGWLAGGRCFHPLWFSAGRFILPR